MSFRLSGWLLALLLLSTSYGYAQYYDDDYDDDYYGSPFNPPPPNSQNPQQQIPGRNSLPGMAGQELQNEAIGGDNGRLIPADSGQVKFKIVEGEFWEPKKKRRASNK